MMVDIIGNGPKYYGGSQFQLTSRVFGPGGNPKAKPGVAGVREFHRDRQVRILYWLIFRMGMMTILPTTEQDSRKSGILVSLV